MKVLLLLVLASFVGVALGAFVTVPVLLIVTAIAMVVVTLELLYSHTPTYADACLGAAASLISGMWMMYFLTTHEAAVLTFVGTYILR